MNKKKKTGNVEKPLMDSSPGQRASTQSDVHPAGFGENKMPVFENPPYSPNIATCDLFLFLKIKSGLKRTRFQSVNAVKKSDAAHLRTFRKRPLTLLPTVDFQNENL